jgi:hypothetical protein
MNQEAIKAAHDLFVKTGYNGDINKFTNLINTNPDALKAAYDLFVKTGYNGDFDRFSELVGVKKKEQGIPQYIERPKEDTESKSAVSSLVSPQTNEEFIAEYGGTIEPKTAEQIKNESRFAYMGRSTTGDQIASLGATNVYAQQELLKSEREREAAERKARIERQKKAEEVYNESKKLKEQNPTTENGIITNQLSEKFNLPVEEINAYVTEGAPYKEEDFFDPNSTVGSILSFFKEGGGYGALGTPILSATAEFIDDMGRAISQGSTQAESVSPSLSVMANLGKMEPEKIKAFTEAGKQMNNMPPSDEMVQFQKTVDEEGGGIWGLIKGLAQNPTVGPQVMASSFAAMANKASLAAAGTVVGGAAAGGAIAGGVGAVPTAIASLPYAMAAASTTLESGLTFQELFSDEMVKRGFVNDKGMADWDNEDGVRQILEDEDAMSTLRTRSLARGITIGAIDAISGGIATKIAAKPALSSMARVARAAKSAGVEMIGGSAGEAAGRAVAGQKMDIVEIGLEGLAEAPMTVVDIAAASVNKPKININGQKVSEIDFDKVLSDVESGKVSTEEFMKMNLTLNNDKDGFFSNRVKSIVESHNIKKKITEANPNMDEETVNQLVDLEKELSKLQGNNTQVAKDRRSEITNKIKEIQKVQPVAEEVVETPEQIKQREDRISLIESMLSGDNVSIAETGQGKLLPETRAELQTELETLKKEQDAIQKQSAEGGVLRPEESEVELPTMGEGDQGQVVTQDAFQEAEQAKQVELPKIEESQVVKKDAGISIAEAKPKKVLFLDINGVIKAATASDEIIPALIRHVNNIIEKTGASVVISSDERTGDINQTRELLKSYGFKHADKIIGETKVRSEEEKMNNDDQINRGQRIEDWKNEFAPDATIVALDDTNAGFGIKTEQFLVSPNTFLGMTEDLANIAIKKLNGEKVDESAAILENVYPTEQELSALEAQAKPVSGGVSINNKAALNSLVSRTPDTLKAKVIRQAVKAANTVKSLFPEFDIVLHEDESTFNEEMDKAKNPDLRGSGGAFVRVKTPDGKTSVKIHVNMSKADVLTIPHEVAHAVFLKSFGDNPKLFKVFRERISKVLSESRVKELNDFASQYSEEESHEEFLVELAAVLVKNQEKIDKVTVSKILELINNIVSRITGGAFVPFKDTSSATATNELVDFFNNISNSISKGAEFEVSKKGEVKAAEGVSAKGRKANDMPMSADNMFYSDSDILPRPDTKVSNSSVAKKLEEVNTIFWGGNIVTSQTITPEQEKIITDNGIEEAIRAYESDKKSGLKTAANWYSTAIENAIAVAGVIHKEITSLAEASKNKFFSKEEDPVAAAQLIMRMALAITSQNLNVDLNTRFANEQFEYYKENGKFDPTKEYGSKANSISSNLKLANLLVEKLGINGAEEFINKEYTVAELEQAFYESTGKKVKVTGLRNDIVNGSAIYGPKIGQGFLQNLLGNFNPVTIDLWMRRTWGRWTGDVVGNGVTEQRMARLYKEVKSAIKSKELSIELPKEFEEYKPVTKTNKNGKGSTFTMDDDFIERIESDPDFVDVLQSLSKKISSIGDKYYKAIHDIPMTQTLYDKFLSGELSYVKTAKKLIEIKNKLGDKYDSYVSKERAAKRKPIKKGDWLNEQYKKMGMTIVPENKEISDRKPEWALAATVIKNDLNPIDIPSNEDRRVISRVVNNIRKGMEQRGYKVTNADVQALLWYPEKDIWAKLKGEQEESNLKQSYDEQFIKIAEQKGLGREAKKAVEDAESRRATRTSATNDGGADVEVSRPSDKKEEIVAKGRKALSSVEETTKALEGVIESNGGYGSYMRNEKSYRLFSLSGLGWHAGESVIKSFDKQKIKGGNRGELGYGYYFSNQSKSFDYGKKITFIDTSSLNLLNGETSVSNEILSQIKNYSPEYDKIRRQISKLEDKLSLSKNNKEYSELNAEINRLKNRLEDKDVYSSKELSSRVRNLVKYIEKYPDERIQDIAASQKEGDVFEIIMNSLGFDGIEVADKWQFNLFPYNEEKINSIIVDNPSEFTSEAYHKAKEDGSNPELVNAVEELLGGEEVVAKGRKPRKGESIKDLDGYKGTMEKVIGIIKKGIESKRTKEQVFENVMNYIQQDSKLYADATDQQREELVREIRNRFYEKEKSAPRAKTILGIIDDPNKITMSQSQYMKDMFKAMDRAETNKTRALKKASIQLAKELNDMVSRGKITLRQMSAIVSRFARVNVLNDDSISKFVDYMTNVISNAEYMDTISSLRKMLPTARKNAGTKLGIAKELMPTLSRLLSINPEFIPTEVLGKYSELVDMLGKRQAVLKLNEINDVIKSASEIMDAVDNKLSILDDLSDRFENSQNKVYDANGKLDYSKTIDKMLEKGEILAEESELMRKNKKKIYSEAKTATENNIYEKYNEYLKNGVLESDAIEKVASDFGIDEQEVSDAVDNLNKEKNDLVGVVYSMAPNMNTDRFSSAEERDLARKLKRLLDTDAVESLSLNDLRNLVKMIDNINNGYISNFAQVMAERLDGYTDGKSLSKSVQSAKPLALSEVIGKIKASIGKDKNYISQMIKRGPLYYIDQVLGDFKSKEIFNAIFEKSAEALSKYEFEVNRIHNILDKAQERVAKSFNNDHNATVMSKFKMMAYMLELENQSNPDSKEVNSAIDILNETLKFIEEESSFYKEKDADMIREIISLYGSSGNIDINQLYNSFNSAEKDAIKTMQTINEMMGEKASFTATVIRGQKMTPISNYVHHNVLQKQSTISAPNIPLSVSTISGSMQPSTKAKSLISRTGAVTPVNLDPFAAVSKGSKGVLMDYYLTTPVRTARRAINQARIDLKKNDSYGKKEREIINGIETAYEAALENILSTSFDDSTLANDILNHISKHGYRAVLASTTRSVSELTSNLGYALWVEPEAMIEGVKYIGVMNNEDGPLVMNNVKSKVTSRQYPHDSLSGKLIDSNIMNQVSGIKGSKSKSSVANVLNKIHNNSTKKYLNFVELTADVLISTPDKIVSRPIWFGTFARDFRKITGQDVDFQKIASNDEAYMSLYADAIEKARNNADESSVRAASSNNGFMASLRGKNLKTDSAFKIVLNRFNNFLTNFMIYEYITARTGIMAAMGNGTISRGKGLRMIAGVTTRMMVYSLLLTSMSKGLSNMVLGPDEDEKEEDEKSILQRITQAFASAGTSLLFGRDFGNVARLAVNYGIEKTNEKYLDVLRNGEYNPYKDALTYSVIPVGKEDKFSASDMMVALSGPFSPMLKTMSFAGEKYAEAAREEQKKKEEPMPWDYLTKDLQSGKLTQERFDNEVGVRIPLEFVGNLGLIPFYKDIHKVVNEAIYRDLRKSKKEAEVKKQEREQDNQVKKGLLYDQYNGIQYESESDMRYRNRILYDERFGPKSDWYKANRDEKVSDAEKQRLIQKMKDDYYKYTPNKKQVEYQKKKDLIKSYGYLDDEEMKSLNPGLYKRLFGDESSNLLPESIIGGKQKKSNQQSVLPKNLF